MEDVGGYIIIEGRKASEEIALLGLLSSLRIALESLSEDPSFKSAKSPPPLKWSNWFWSVVFSDPSIAPIAEILLCSSESLFSDSEGNGSISSLMGWLISDLSSLLSFDFSSLSCREKQKLQTNRNLD